MKSESLKSEFLAAIIIFFSVCVLSLSGVASAQGELNTPNATPASVVAADVDLSDTGATGDTGPQGTAGAITGVQDSVSEVTFYMTSWFQRQ